MAVYGAEGKFILNGINFADQMNVGLVWDNTVTIISYMGGNVTVEKEDY